MKKSRPIKFSEHTRLSVHIEWANLSFRGRLMTVAALLRASAGLLAPWASGGVTTATIRRPNNTSTLRA
jgi:hypothetical protein